MFFILNKLADIFGDHSYVSDLVIRNLDITKKDFDQIVKSFCNITSLSIIDCHIEFTPAISKLNIKEFSITNSGFDDADLLYLNLLNNLEILNFIDIAELNLTGLTVLETVKNLSLVYVDLVDSDVALSTVRSEFFDIRGTLIDNELLLCNDNLKTLITSVNNPKIINALKENGVEVKFENE